MVCIREGLQYPTYSFVYILLNSNYISNSNNNTIMISSIVIVNDDISRELIRFPHLSTGLYFSEPNTRTLK